MPTFDFQCADCGTIFEFKRSFRSTKVPHCPACKSKETEKLIAPPTIHFHGSGFFVTDHGGKSGKSPEKKPEKATDKEQKKEETKAPPETEKEPQKVDEKPKSE
ncbi:MAG: zinc ribbon domain-containing protein [Candidatus Peregrinibacteria bacterium]